MKSDKSFIIYIIAALLFITQVVFLALKLCNVINWHWALIFLPTMIPVAFLLIMVLMTVVIIFSLANED